MSAFFTSIHHRLYHKIIKQELLTECGGTGEPCDQLRSAWTPGMLAGSEFTFKQDGRSFAIERMA